MIFLFRQNSQFNNDVLKFYFPDNKANNMSSSEGQILTLFW